jgi:hypothetical protein
MRLSDTRLFKIVQHIQSLPFPKSKHSSITMTETFIKTTTQQTLKTIEDMTPVKKIREKVANEDQDIEIKPSEFIEQFIQFEGNFELSQVKKKD